MDFLDLMNTLFDLQKKFPDMEWDCKGGILSIRTYVGMENHDLLNAGRQMFAPAD